MKTGSWTGPVPVRQSLRLMLKAAGPRWRRSWSRSRQSSFCVKLLIQLEGMTLHRRPQSTVGLIVLEARSRLSSFDDLHPTGGAARGRRIPTVRVHPVDAQRMRVRLTAEFDPVADLDSHQRRWTGLAVLYIVGSEDIVDRDIVNLVIQV